MLFVFLFAVVLSPLAFALSHAVIREGLEKGRLFPDGKRMIIIILFPTYIVLLYISAG